MKNRRSLTVFLLLLMFGSLVLPLIGCSSITEEIPIPRPEEDVYVYDQDNLFEDSVENQLNAMLIDLEEKTGTEFVVLSIESLLGKDIEDYSITVANELGIGKEKEDNGVLLIISRSDERVRLEIGKGLEELITDSKSGQILDDFFVPYRDEDEYSTATTLTVQAVINVIANDANVSIEGVDETIVPEEEQISIFDVVFLLILLLVLIIVAAIFISGSGGGGHYGGGFYSSGSSRSFGGFGGGSFGGGGASR